MESIEGEGFIHDVHWRAAPRSRTLWIFVEGDGEAYLQSRVITDDPTPKYPLALRLTALTPGTVAYLGRPCYYNGVRDLRCTPSMWTVDRYSDAVIASMNAVATRLAMRTAADQIVLVGHSGGGTIATLMAQSLPRVQAVVTIAGNLDVTAWTALHHYWPLSGSRNPADEPPLPHSVVQIHLVGEKDEEIPPEVSTRYLANVAEQQVWRFKSFDHTCCWAWKWKGILKRIDKTLAASAAGTAVDASK